VRDDPKTQLAAVCALAFVGEALLVWWNWHSIAPSSAAIESLKALLLARGSLAQPAVRSGFAELLGKLLLLDALTLGDFVLNVVVIVLATKRAPEDYPPRQNKAAWLAALWVAFLVVQVPTGIPSALAYWIFIARVPRASRSVLRST